MATINELIQDASIRHQIGLRRYSAGQANKVLRLLEKADKELADKLRKRLVAFEGKPVDFTSKRWKALIDDITALRAETMREFRDVSRKDLNTLAAGEAKRELDILDAAIDIEMNFAAVSADQLRAIATTRPFQGRLLKDWFQSIELADRTAISQALKLGLAQGETTDSIVRRIIGTRKADYTDGIVAMTRRNAETVVRTAINHISNVARNYVWEENSDIVQAKIWHATLDGRTTAVCRSRDGKGSPVGKNTLPKGVVMLDPPGIQPPAHMNCRSIMVAYISGIGLVGERPFVVERTAKGTKKVDFKAMAKEQGITTKEARVKWADRVVGRVPAEVTYGTFLARQSAAFQDQVLGKTKGRLFRQGGLKIEGFVDRRGNELTLSQLAETNPQAFRRAGLNPSDY